MASPRILQLDVSVGTGSLTPLDRTKLVVLFLAAAAKKVKMTGTEGWCALTWRQEPEVDSTTVSIRQPVVRVHEETLQQVQDQFMSYATDAKGRYEHTLDLTEAVPSDDGTWSKPVIYDDIPASYNSPAKTVEVFQWIGLKGKDRKLKNISSYYDNPYTFWNESRSEAYVVRDSLVVGTTTPLSKKMDKILDAVSCYLPKLTGVKRGELKDYEEYDKLFVELMGIIEASPHFSQPVNVRDESSDVLLWMDLAAIAASCRSPLSTVEATIDKLYVPDQRRTLELDRKSLNVRYQKAIRAKAKGEAVLSLETLIEYAIKYNHDAYELWWLNWMDEHLNAIYNGTISGAPALARLLSRYSRTTQLYDQTTRSWWIYNDECKSWIRGEVSAKLIEGGLKPVIESKIELLQQFDDHDKAMLENLTKTLRPIVGKRCKGGKNDIRSELEDLLFTHDFSKWKDRQYNSLPLLNCCIEVLEQNGKRRVIIRDHRTQDYVTTTAHALYDAEYHWEHPEVKEVLEFYRRFIPDEETRECLLLWVGSTLWRGNRDRTILSMLGGGGNGKTAFIASLSCISTFIANVKGTSLYGTEKNAGAADTELIALEHKALGVIEEVEHGRIGRTAIIKAISGGGKVPLRGIFQAERPIDSTAKLLIIQNDHIHWPEDDAMVDRLYPIRCVSRFDEHAPASIEEQEAKHHYPKDTTYTERLASLSDAALWIYVRYLEKYVAMERLPRSKASMEEADSYWKMENIYRSFVSIICTCPSPGYVTVSRLLLEAKRYFSTTPFKAEYNQERLLSYIKSLVGIRQDDKDIGYDEKTQVIHGISIQE